jgi:peptide/nickel transport system substrate-binding protein
MRMRAGAALLAMAVLAGTAACSDDDTGASGDGGDASGAEGGELTWLVEQPWGGVYNTYRTGGSSYYLRQILAGVVPVAGDFTPEGEWEFSTDLFVEEPSLTAESPQTMVFPVSPDAVWSDGEAIDVDDFRFNWFHNSGREDQCVGCEPADSTGWELVDTIEATDDGKTVTITLQDGAADAEWYAHFGPSVYPAHVAEAAGFDWQTPDGMGQASQHFVTTAPTWSGGPYLLDSVVADERAVLVPNPRWYGATEPKLDRIVLEVIPNPGDWSLAIQNGELDGGAPLAFNPDVLAQLEGDGGVETSVGSGGGTFDHLELNARRPALADLELRRAILTAVDVEQLRQRTFGDTVEPALRTNTFFETSDPRHEDVLAATGFGSGDVEGARSILEEAGYTGAEAGGSLAKDGVEVPDLSFLHGPNKVTVAEVVQAQLAEIGITITPTPVVPSEALGTLAAGTFDLAAFSLGGGPLVVGAPGQLFQTGSPINFTKVEDPAIDALIDELRTVVEAERVAELANEIATLALEHATLMTLWDNPSFAFVRDGFVNVRDNRYSSVRALDDAGAWALAADG